MYFLKVSERDHLPSYFFFQTFCPEWPWGPPSLLHERYSREKRGRGVALNNTHSLCSTEVKERVELYTCTPTLGLHGLF